MKTFIQNYIRNSMKLSNEKKGWTELYNMLISEVTYSQS